MATEDNDRLRAQPRLRPQPPQIKQHQKFLQTYLGSTRRRIAASLTFLAVVVTLGEWSWSVYQNTFPEVTARNSETDSTFLLPFILQNKSTVFDMKNVELTCGIGTFILGNGKQTIVTVAGFTSSQLSAVIPAGHPADFPCDASKLVKFEGAKGIDIMGLHTDLPGIEPMKITGIQVTVGMRIPNIGLEPNLPFRSFDWTCTPQGCHWTKGPTIH